MPIAIIDEGAIANAGKFRVLGQNPSILVTGGKVTDAMTITVEDQVYGVVFSFTIPRSEWAGEGTQVAAADYASYVQQIGGHDHVIAAAYTQEVDAAGNLFDALAVTVATADEENTAEVVIPMRSLNTPGAFAKIDAAYNTLARTAALT